MTQVATSSSHKQDKVETIYHSIRSWWLEKHPKSCLYLSAQQLFHLISEVLLWEQMEEECFYTTGGFTWVLQDVVEMENRKSLKKIGGKE